MFRPPSLVLAAESLAPGNGGIGRVARLTARALGEECAAGRLRAVAVALSDTEADGTLGIPLRTCAGSRLRFALRVQRAAMRSSHVMYDFAGMARAHRALAWMGKPMACWMHGVDVWESARPDRVHWCRRAGLLLANSAYTRDRATRVHGGLAHAKVCWLATEDDLAPPPVDQARQPHVLIVGRIPGSTQLEVARDKGHERLIAAWAEVVRHVPEARLVIVGNGPGRVEVEALAKASPAARAIDFLGFVPDEKLPEIFGRCRVFAMPSRGEGFGLVYIEAMRHGLPVIASTADAAPEVSLEGVTGFNVDLDRPQELPMRIVQLLQNEDLARRMGEAGQRRWAERFRFSAFKERFLDLLYPWLRGETVK